jgi:hypothetical protein
MKSSFKMCNPFFYEFRVQYFRLFMYPSSSAVQLLYTPQRLKARGLILIGVLISLARGEGRGAMIWLLWKLARAGLHLPHGAVAAELQATIHSSCWYFLKYRIFYFIYPSHNFTIGVIQ